MSLTDVKALTFDVFGTVVDWRSSVIRQCRELGGRFGVSTDWETFTDEWRYDGYIGGIRKVLAGELPFMTTDQLHRRKLESMLSERGIESLGEEQLREFNHAWHRLEPWPDSVAGLARLRSKFVVSTLSNGNVSLLVDMAKYAGLTWDCVLSAEVTGAFKPAPECYLAAARLLDLEPRQVLMVAAHKNDLKAAQAVGLQAAFVPRAAEAGPSVKVDLSPDPAFQLNATDFLDLAAQLGC